MQWLTLQISLTPGALSEVGLTSMRFMKKPASINDRFISVVGNRSIPANTAAIRRSAAALDAPVYQPAVYTVVNSRPATAWRVAAR